MRSFVGKNPHLMVVWLIALLVFFSWSGIAQEIKELDAPAEGTIKEPADLTPTFNIVAPLNKDILSGKSIFIIRPTADIPDMVAALQVSGEKGNYEAKFSENDNWMHAMDTTQLQNGLYDVTFSLCAQGICEKKSIQVVIENKDPASTGTGEIPSGGGKDPEPTPTEPNPAPTEPAPPVEAVLVIPSNHAGAFYLSNRDDPALTLKSSGDPLKIAKGKYDATFDFFDGEVSALKITNAKIDQDGIIAQWIDNPITQPVRADGENYEPVSSFAFAFGFPAENISIQLVPHPEYALIWCKNWDKEKAGCSAAQVLDASADNPLVETTDQEMVLVLGKPIVEVSNDPQFHQVVPSSLPAHAFFFNPNDGSIKESLGERVELQSSSYDANAYFEDFPIRFIAVSAALIDHNDTLFQFPFFQRTDKGVVTLQLDEGYGFSSGFFALENRYTQGSMWKCALWNASLNDCLGNWQRTYETTLPHGTIFLRFFPPGVDTNTIEIPPTELPNGPGEISDEQALLEAIARMKSLYKNMKFFQGTGALEQYGILGSLFSDFQVAMACDSSIATPGIIPVPGKPIPVEPNDIDANAPTVANQDGEAAPSASVDAPSGDENVVIQFQSVEGETASKGSEVSVEIIPNAEEVALPVPEDPRDPVTPNPLSSAWEEGLTPSTGEAENFIDCGGVTLQNTYVQRLTSLDGGKIINLGELKPQLKQVLSFVNNSFYEQQRTVRVRMVVKAAAVHTGEKAIIPQEDYQGIRTKVEVVQQPSFVADENALPIFAQRVEDYRVQFLDANAGALGSYDWKDYWDANAYPITLVHAGKEGMIVDTLLSVKIGPGEQKTIDPIFDLTGVPNFTALWDGNRAGDMISNTLDSNQGIQIVNIDNNAGTNDLLITAPLADFNGKVNVGAVYLIKDFNRYTGTFGLANAINFDLAFYGGAIEDNLGRTTLTNIGNGPGVQVVNVDGNSYANDLLITAINADVNGKTDVGAVYLIKDIDKKTGQYDLANTNGVNSRWSGSTASDRIGYTIQGGLGVKIANLDNNVAANDLIIAAAQANGAGGTDNGSVYVIKDINTFSETTLVIKSRDLNLITSYNARFDGNYVSTENLGDSLNFEDGIQIVNVDNNATANDLIIQAGRGDKNGKTDAGIVYLIKNVQNKSGNFLFNATTSFDATWTGGTSWFLGTTAGSGFGVKLLDLNGDGFQNDMLINANLADFNGRGDNGVIFLITDINSLSGEFDLNTGVLSNFRAMWYGLSQTDRIGAIVNANSVGGEYADSIQIVNLDGNTTANDMIINAPLVDFNGKTDSGAVYLIKDINKVTGTKVMYLSPNYSAAWFGEAASDFLGRNNNQDQAVQLVNIDNNLYANDLLIAAPLADLNGKTNNGGVYLVKDINNTINNTTGINYIGNFTTTWARWVGGGSEFLSDTNGSRQGVQLVNLDGNQWANDLLITAPSGDANGLTDNGIVYLIEDINARSGSFDLNSIMPRMFAARWYGDKNFMRLGDTNKSGIGVMVVNSDNNSAANDLLLLAPGADLNVPDAGEIYYIRDAHLKDQNQWLGNPNTYFALFRGDQNNEAIGDSNSSGPGVFLLDTDSNGYTNDLIITSYNIDYNTIGQTDLNLVYNNGAIFYLRDIDKGSNALGKLTASFLQPGTDANVYGRSEIIQVSARILCVSSNCGSVDTNLEYCYGNTCSDARFWDMNTAASSPLYIVSGTNPQNSASLQAGQTYDVNWTILGATDYNFELRLSITGTTANPYFTDGLNNTIVIEPNNSLDQGRRSSFYSRYTGSRNSDFFGFARHGLEGIAYVNVDNGAYANDLIITAAFTDFNGRTDSGSIYLIKNVDVNQGPLDVNHLYNFDLRIDGARSTDYFGTTQLSTGADTASATGIQLVNLDGNAYANDLVINTSQADGNAKTDNGAVYIIKDIDKKNGIRDVNNPNNVDLVIYGSVASDTIGGMNQVTQGIIVANLDGNYSANDLIIAAPRADINGKVNNGAVYIIKDINTLRGERDLNMPTMFNAVFMGGIASDQIGLNENGGQAVGVFNLDGNVAANDIVISSYVADVNGKSNNGAVYVIRDINRLSGYYDFNVLNTYTYLFNGGQTGDALGAVSATLRGNDNNVWEIVNIDGNQTANDLLITAYAADFNGKVDVGALFLIKDLNVLAPGRYDFNHIPNYTTAFTGSRGSDLLTSTAAGNLLSSSGFKVVNLDNGAYANDLYIAAARTDWLRTNGGSIYFLQNIDTNYGIKDFNNLAAFRSRFDGSVANDAIGDTNGSGPAVQIGNMDGNAYSNDVIFNVPFADFNARTNNGLVYLVPNINTKSGIFDLNTATNYQTKWAGQRTRDTIGDTNRSGAGVMIVNLDGNSISNDLIIIAPNADIGDRNDTGAIYLILDANTSSGEKQLDNPNNFKAAWTGASDFDFIGNAVTGGNAVVVDNLDNNAFANDLLISAGNADVSLKLDNGAGYVIEDANRWSGFNNFLASASYTKRLVGRIAGNRLSAAYYGNDAFDAINLDNNAYDNDILLSSPLADANGKSNNGALSIVQNILTAYVAAANNYGFVLLLPSSSCTADLGNQEGADGPCHRAWFEATDVIGLTDENQVQADGQSNGIPFLQYDNQSSTNSDLNILLDLNASLPTTLILKVSQIFTGWAGTCTGNTDTNCLRVTTTPTSAGKALYSVGTQDLNLYVWGDFNGATTGRVDRNVDSNSVSPV